MAFYVSESELCCGIVLGRVWHGFTLQFSVAAPDGRKSLEHTGTMGGMQQHVHFRKIYSHHRAIQGVIFTHPSYY